MKVIIDKKTLLSHLQLAYAISSWNDKLDIPIIKNVLIDVENSILSIKTISSGVCRCSSIIKEVDIIQKGTVLVNTRNLLEIVEKSDDSKIMLEKIDNSILRLSYYGYETNLNILDWEQFPNFEIDNYSLNNELPISKNDLNFISKKVIFSSSVESIFQQQVHDSVQIDSESFDGKIYFSFTNSIQLISWNKPYSGVKFKFCIQKDVFKNIEWILKLSDSTKIYLWNNNIYVKNDFAIMEIKNWEEILGLSKFGDVTKIIRDESLVYLNINRRSLTKALEKSLIFRSGKSKIIKFIISRDKVVIKTNSEEIGNSKEEILIKTKGVNDGFEINIDASYLLSIIKMFEAEEIEIGLGGQNMDIRIDPILIKDQSLKNYVQIIALSVA